MLNAYIKQLVENYFSSNEQMLNSLKAAEKDKAKYDKENDNRHLFLISTIGKPLYNKFLNNGAFGTFAPIYWSSLKIDIKDIKDFLSKNMIPCSDENLEKLCKEINVIFPKTTFNIRGEEFCSNYVMNKMDDVIDLFLGILKAFNKIAKHKYNTTEINWTPFCKKVRIYFKN